MGERPRLTVNAREAVHLFRSGMSDADLMRRYNISARSLERLFKKLVDEGAIAKAELNHRLYKSQRSHVVDVVSDAVERPRVTQKKKIKISAGDVVSRIKSGMSDIDLMDQYNLSALGLERLLRKLVRRGDIAEDYLEERKRAFHWADIAFVKSEGQSPETLDDRGFDLGANHIGFREFVEEYKVVLSALLGALGGMLFTAVLLVSLAGLDTTRNLVMGAKTSASADGPPDTLDAAAQNMVSTLESIARGDPGTSSSDPEKRSPQYEQCMKDCDKDHADGDDAEKVLWIECRKSCVAQHSKRLKAIRELYHRPRFW